ncbi:methyltransferase family protein [Sunxiuqinia sp. sy24]|uniref:methyltransferase family protein n=1 Tax=Sunxiuqinia sp. sy24 TaxID=3461495 RepID=UPI0040459CD1
MLIQLGLIFLSGFPLLSTALLAYQLLRNGQGAMGVPSITAWLFYPAKLTAGVLLFILFPASLSATFFDYFPWLIQHEVPEVQQLLSLIFLLAGNLLLIPAYYTMSIFTRVGLPTKDHALQTNGIYRISRNPMYTSFFFFFTACFLLIPSLLVAALGLFSLIIHHFIILSEEKFMASSFSSEYQTYQNQTARYL